MHIVSFHTGEGVYADFAAKLRASCDRFNIPCIIEQLPSTGNWVRNNAMKPRWVLEQLRKLGSPVVWCDADCEVMQDPVILRQGGADFMIYNWFADMESGAGMYNPRTLGAAGGVFYVDHTPAGIDLLERWARACAEKPDRAEDRVINALYIRELTPLVQSGRLRVRWLPRAYNRMDSKFPAEAPIINHVYTAGKIFTGQITDAAAPRNFSKYYVG